MIAAITGAIKGAITGSIGRTGLRAMHLLLANPGYLVIFAWRLLVASLAALLPRNQRDRSPDSPRFLKRLVGKSFRALYRGILPIVALGIAGGIGLGEVAGGLGALTRPIFNTEWLAVIIRSVLPIVLCAVVIARHGSTLAAKFATYLVLPEVEPDGTRQAIMPERIDDRELPALVIPYIVAGVVSSAFFYLLFVALALGGYLLEGDLAPLRGDGITDGFTFLGDMIGGFVATEGLDAAIRTGLLLSALFGGIAAYVAVALGIQAAEQRLDYKGELRQYYDVVWESSTTSFVIALLVLLVV